MESKPVSPAMDLRDCETLDPAAGLERRVFDPD